VIKNQQLAVLGTWAEFEMASSKLLHELLPATE
jgi:hypothetical protein